ncbi:MAG: hypothetical protein LUH11_04150 [Candidatus Gastranaerophilales bacterium]|nr:hypothetical protein [Candidatus Gastranaerophilales bacterium]
MIQLESFSLLILAACLAYILNCIFSYIEKCKINYNLKKIKNDSLYKKRCEKLHDNAFFYYYTLATTRPEALCYDLASIDIARLKRNGLINEMYTKMKKEEKGKCQN